MDINKLNFLCRLSGMRLKVCVEMRVLLEARRDIRCPFSSVALRKALSLNLKFAIFTRLAGQ